MIYSALGLMSGTSLDGLDMALCRFNTENFSDFDILKTQTVSYSDDLSRNLRNSLNFTAVEFIELHKKYGEFLSKRINEFLKSKKVDFIATHGHTSIHFPEKNVNFQLGDGATISALTGIPVICDFRSLDIALGGQGAPLVPAGEKYLFPEFDTFLNIGGFANISFWRKKITAFDITPANYALNFFSRKLGETYDYKGKIGKKGILNKKLLIDLQNLKYFSEKPPKSLADHWFYDVFLKKIYNYTISETNILRTIYELISSEIALNLDNYNTKKVMLTGGGAYNDFLINLIKAKTKAEIFIPEDKIIQYKEALIFAFLGFLRWTKNVNCLKSVTGALFDNIGGAIYFNKKSKYR